MNPWLDFFLTLLVRFVCGVIIGIVLSFIFGFRTNMRAIADGQLPIERFIVWGLAAGVITMFTTPRDAYPWVKQ